jgi:acyl carrier protein
MRREREAMGDVAGGTAAGADLVEALRALLAELSEGRLAVAEIDPAANLFDFGYVDSLSGVMFLARIEEQWGVHVEDFDLVERLNTLDAVAAHVRANL